MNAILSQRHGLCGESFGKEALMDFPIKIMFLTEFTVDT